MESLAQIVNEARREAGVWTGPQLAELLGCSVRSVYRHSDTGGVLYPSEHRTLLRATYPTNPALADRYARALGTSLEALGLGAAPKPASAVTADHADLVVHAAAEALDMSPRAVRAGIAAAFAKAHELRVPVEGLVPHLAGKPAPRRKA